VRPSYLLLTLFLCLLGGNGCLYFLSQSESRQHENRLGDNQNLVMQLGLSDLALTTEARYTRHPAISDPMAPFMDHPGAIEHFPSGSFLRPGSEQQLSR
jgi:hypothetical protein